MPRRPALKRYLPGGVVSAVLGLAFLLPAGAFATAFAATGYSNAIFYGGQTFKSTPDTSASSGTSESIFARGNDDAAWQVAFNPSTGAFGGASSLGGAITADPGAVAQGTRIDLLVRGSDNQMYHKIFNGTTWSGWTVLGGILSTGPDASLRGGSVDSWVGGADAQLYHKWSDDGGNTWTQWEALGGILTSDPRAVSWSSGRVDVFVRGSDNQMYHKFWDTTIGWSNWEALGGILTSAPDVASCTTGHLDVFVRGTDNSIWNKYWNGSAWSAWINLNTGTVTSSVSAICRPGTTLIDIFMKGSDNQIWTFNIQSH